MTEQSDAQQPRFALTLSPTPGVLPDDPMSEAGRKILLHQFEIMLKNEPDARAGESTDAIHDMRVATRRMRSAIHILGDFYKKRSPLTIFGKELKRIAAALGGVRDLDVFSGKIKDYLDDLPTDQQQGLEAFRQYVKKDEEHARRVLQELLDSERYARFVTTFHTFLTTSGAGAAAIDDYQPSQVRHVVPRLIYERYTAMRAYETILENASLDTLHQIRIEGKQMRYTLEFFAEVLGPESKTAIDAVKALQDHLGNLQDTRVASEMLQNYLRGTDERENIAPVATYLAVREAEKQSLLIGVPAAWENFTDRKVRRAIALAVAAL